MRCIVEVGERPIAGAAAPIAWEAVRDAVRADPAQDDLLPARMTEPTRLVPSFDAAGLYAAASFARGRDWLEATFDLMHRIHADFEFEPGSTTVSTSIDEVLYQRSGVCQDFAHLMLGCLRGHGLPARYMSGYLLTDPPPGRPRLLGADASHAWVVGLRAGPRLGRVRPDQRPHSRPALHHAGLGRRLRRCGAAARRAARRPQPAHDGRSERDSRLGLASAAKATPDT